jgi:Amt family ammonium transporter
VGTASYLGKAGQGVTGLLHGDASQLLVQLGGATLCALYAFGFTFIVFKIVNAVYPIRVSADEEIEGLDVPQFGMLAYPESGDEMSAAV